MSWWIETSWHHQVDDGRKWRLHPCVLMEIRESLMLDAHEGVFAGHFSPNSVLNNLAQYCWWDGMYRDVHAHILSWMPVIRVRVGK